MFPVHALVLKCSAVPGQFHRAALHRCIASGLMLKCCTGCARAFPPLVGRRETQSTGSKVILLLVIRLSMLVQYFRKPLILCSFNSKEVDFSH